MMQSAVTSLVVFISLFSIAVQANEPLLPTSVKQMRVELDIINFELKDQARLDRLENMIANSEELAKKHEKDAGFLMMAGFFNAQYAGAKGGMGALKYAKAARDYLEASVAIDPTIYEASAHSVLGSLYDQVPGWPVGYGDKKKALLNYKKALEIAPDGMDSNFTYATHLYENKKYAEAKIHLEKAKVSPPRPLRPKADEELHKVIDEALIEIEKKLN